ncbi:hypothetical protein J1614_001483 [Plenodomus biglobosus]|nr:hypothetical protein J1614_001483 [Plenodomus biglobosus]
MRRLDPLIEDDEGSAAVDVFLPNPLKQVVSNGSNVSGADSAVGGVGLGHGTRRGTGVEADFGTGAGGREVEHVYLDLDDDHDDHEGTTLIAGSDEGIMQGIKQMDVEITDNEASDSDAEAHDKDPDFSCGIKRKRTIRLIIRSRAFL